MNSKNYKADEMEQFSARIQNATSETQTEESWGSLNFWQAVIYEGDSPSLATVGNALMGDATTGTIKPITEESAAKLLGR